MYIILGECELQQNILFKNFLWNWRVSLRLINALNRLIKI